MQLYAPAMLCFHCEDAVLYRMGVQKSVKLRGLKQQILTTGL